MNIHEYQAKQLFRDFAIPVPRGAVAESAQQAMHAAESIAAASWVIKAQIHAGARGKAGGVKVADSFEQVKNIDNFNQHHEAPERLEGFHFVFFMRFMVNSKDLV